MQDFHRNIKVSLTFNELLKILKSNNEKKYDRNKFLWYILHLNTCTNFLPRL